MTAHLTHSLRVRTYLIFDGYKQGDYTNDNANKPEKQRGKAAAALGLILCYNAYGNHVA